MNKETKVDRLAFAAIFTFCAGGVVALCAWSWAGQTQFGYRGDGQSVRSVRVYEGVFGFPSHGALLTFELVKGGK